MILKFVNILDCGKATQEKVRQWRNSDDIRRWMIRQEAITPSQHGQWLKSLEGSDNTFWVVSEGNVPIGAAYLQQTDAKSKTTEWGFYIGQEEYRSKGFGRKILFQLLEEVFERRGLKKLVTRVLSDNTVAMALYRKFHFENKKEYVLEDGRKIAVLELESARWPNICKTIHA